MARATTQVPEISLAGPGLLPEATDLKIDVAERPVSHAGVQIDLVDDREPPRMNGDGGSQPDSIGNGTREYRLAVAKASSSMPTDGDTSDAADDPALQGTELNALVIFEGDTDSCSPHKFNPYTGYEELGRGSYGVVFMVKCEACGNVYARKVISFRGLNSAEKTRFIRTTNNELTAYKTLSHPHVLKYVHHELTERRMDIFTEYCEWRDLDGFMGEQEKLLPEDFIWHVMQGLISALTRCHYGLAVSVMHELVDEYLYFEAEWEPILHRDVKPGNCLLLAERKAKEPSTHNEYNDELSTLVPKLGDFGTCYKLERGKKRPSTHRVGTKAFWAPEIQDEGRRVEMDGRITSWSEKSDMWGAGGVLYGMLTSDIPEKGYHREIKCRMSHISERLPKGHDPLLLRIVSDCFDPDPETRVTALHILPVTLKANTSPLALSRSSSFWKTLTKAPASIPVASVVSHFVTAYLPTLAKDETTFSPKEVSYIMGLVSQYAPVHLLSCSRGLAAGFRGPLEGGSVFHALGFLSGEDGDTIHYAMEVSRWPKVKEVSHIILQQSKKGLLPSATAAYRGNLELSRLLQQAEEAARRVTQERVTKCSVEAALRDASEHHLQEFDAMFSFMISHMVSSVSISKSEGAEAVIKSAQRGYCNITKKLVGLGINPSIRGRHHETALHIFCHSGSLDMITFLIQGGAEVDARDKDGRTPLHWAAWAGQSGAVRELLAAKADVNAQDLQQRTPLYGAAGGGHEAVVRVLVSHKADSSIKGGRSRETALERATKRGRHGVVAILSTTV